MKDKSKRIRSNREQTPEPRPSFGESSNGRLMRRGSTIIAEDRPVRRGSSDTSHEPS